jgi:hydrocephalus-inducing protein
VGRGWGVGRGVGGWGVGGGWWGRDRDEGIFWCNHKSYHTFSFKIAYRATDIQFGTLAVGESRQITFRLANLSETNVIKFQWMSVPTLVFIPTLGHIRPKTSKTITVTFKTSKPQAFKAHKVVGKLCKISFQKPLSEVPDWDDRMKSVQWVIAQPPPPPPQAPTGLENASNNSIPASSSSSSKPAPPSAPLKKKIVETEREPAHQVSDDSQRDVELSITGIADFCKYECPIRDIRFKETLIYQTRSFSFPLKNTGRIDLNYHWTILVQDSRPPSCAEDRDSYSAVDGKDDVIPFSVSPMSGTIMPDKEIDVTVRFSPQKVMEVHYLIHC